MSWFCFVFLKKRRTAAATTWKKKTPLLHWKHAVLISNNSCRVIALTTNTCAFMWTKLANRGLHAGRSSSLTSRAASRRPEAPLSWAPFWYLLWPHPSLFYQYDIWPCCVHRSKNCTLFLIKMSLGVVFFFHMTKRKKNFPNVLKALRLLMQNLSEDHPPTSTPTAPHLFFFFFDTLDNKKCFIFMILPDLLLDRVSLCVCACLSGRSWRTENVSSRATVYLCGYLFE